MATIVTRTGKGSPLTHAEVDTNFTNLNTNKLEAGAIALGSAATPSISFTGDTNTGIYSPGADQVAVATNGTEKLIVLSNGNVGIGTSSPGGKLDVRDAGTTIPALGAVGTGLNVRRTDGAIGLIIGYENTIGGSYIQAQHTNGSAVAYPLYLQPNGGNVGIGTTSPGTELQINATTPTIRLEENSAGSKRLELSVNSSAEAKVFATQSGSQLLFGTVGTERARIDSSGRLLVGTVTQVGNVNGGILQLGSGITFPATAVAASDANTLDDYEEGTWTPTVIGSTTAGTATYVLRNAKYTKTGRTVFVEALLNYTAGNGTGDLFISGLPFTSADSVTTPAIAASIFSGITLTVGHVLTMRVENTNTLIGFYSYPLGGGGYATVAYDGEGVIGFSGSYTV